MFNSTCKYYNTASSAVIELFMTIVDGQWSDWSPWGSCTVTCGNGTQTRTRTCTNPTPKYGGAACDGSADDFQDCTNNLCPGGA